MQDNATATTVSASDTWYKAAGTTTAGLISKYTHTDNKLTNGAVIERKYLMQCNISFTTGNNKVCKFGFYDSKSAAVLTPSQTKSTSNGNGRAENIAFSDIISHSSGDYIEIHCQNNSNTDNITIVDMNVVITEII
jgi:hypothetical protein